MQQANFMSHSMKRLRKALFFTQSEIAHKIGVSLQVWQQWEYGKRIPRGDFIIKLLHLAKSEGQDLLEFFPVTNDRLDSNIS